MIAAHHGEQPPRVRKFTLLDVFHPGAVDPDRNFMLTLARHGARVTTDALAIVDEKAKRRHFRIFPSPPGEEQVPLELAVAR